MTSRMPYWRFGALICLLATQPALAVDCDAPVVLGDKPSMDGYADYSDFLVAIMDYKTRERDLQAQQEACPELFITRVDPTSLDPTVTYGPETLDSAVERSARIPVIDYSTNRTWYNRSTSRSFGLPDLPNGVMEQETISTQVRTLVDGNLSARDQQLVLDLIGPLPNDDGAWAERMMERQLTEALARKEQDVSTAFSVSDGDYNNVLTFDLANGGYLSLYMNGMEIVRTEGLLVSCTSTC